MLRWRLILEEYGPDIEYIKGENNIVAYALSRTPSNGNEDTTQNSTYKHEIVSDINDTEEIPEGNFHINLTLIQKHQRKEPSITAKYKDGTYHNVFFMGEVILILNL